MSKVNNFLENKVMPVAAKIAGQRHLQALRDGLILTMPLLIIGSIFLVIRWLPWFGDPNRQYMITNEFLQNILNYPFDATFNTMALIAAFGIAYRLAESYKVDGLTAGAVSLVTFLMVTPFKTVFTLADKTTVDVGGVIPTALTGSGGLFVAIIVALLSTEIYRFVVQKDIIIKMPDGVPPSVSKSFVALIPGFIVIIIFWLLRIGIEQTSFESVHNIVRDLLQQPISKLSGTLVGMLVVVFLVELLWTTGLHGASIVGGVMSPIWLQAAAENAAAMQAGKEVPHIFTGQFYEIFVHVGGSGATLALVFAMVLFAKSQQLKQLGRLSIGPGIFNINEPITFGMPIVMNPVMMIPFILAPLAIVITTWMGMEFFGVAKPNGAVPPWTTPIFLGGFLATGKVSSLVMQLVNFGVAFAIYFPFMKAYDKTLVKQENDAKNSAA
ncbi:PTS cellobiose transporter subunit IIC [Neobacillus niacini]|uniref:PTS cellobiose transporter subunit IIC n=1 Tax=Neobacillus niacini TaxID=86668 RepID=UPI0021CB8DBE|nr:PTS cellobiose transporter subunit IIC [Neobacillus niacini]MCM3765967.1 PTS cellobiose transporter subunit IIC [Neobacillus niacini]